MLKQIRLGAVAFVILAGAWLASAPALASQGSCVMPTSGTVSGLTLVNDINACNNSLISLWSGASAPASPQAGQLWFNTSTNYIQQYDGTQWANLWFVDASNHLIAPPIGGGITTASLAGAGTTNLGSIPQAFKTVSGSGATITSFGSSAITGSIHVVKFAGANTITYNASSLLTPGLANITTAAGDIATMIHHGSGNWQIIDYVIAARSPQMAAYSFLGNNTGASGNPTDVTIPGLTAKTSPVGADLLMIADSAASNALKKLTLTNLLTLLGTQQPSLGGASGLVITNNTSTPNTSIDVTADSVVMVSATPTPIYRTSVSVTINTTTTGCNALDTGTRAGNTWYNIWALDNGTTTCGIISLSATSPTLPGGYTYAARLGAMRTDVSGNFFRSKQRGKDTLYNGTTGPRQITTTVTGASPASAAIANFIPPTATAAKFSLYGAAVLANGEALGLAPMTPLSTAAYQAFFQNNLGGSISTSPQAMTIWADMVLDSNTSIFYLANSTTIDLRAHGWTDRVNAN